MTNPVYSIWIDEEAMLSRVQRIIADDRALFHGFPRLKENEDSVTMLLPYYLDGCANYVVGRMKRGSATSTIKALMLCSPSWLKRTFRLEDSELVALLMAVHRLEQSYAQSVFLDAIRAVW